MSLLYGFDEQKQLELATAPLTDTGFVTSVPSGNRCKINGTEDAVICMNLTIVQNDLVLIVRAKGTTYVVGKLPTPAPGNNYPPYVQANPNSGTTNFSPMYTNSYRSAGWRTDRDNVIQGTYEGLLHTGAWFYGGAIHDLLQGAICQRIQMKIHRLAGGLAGKQIVQLAEHSSDLQPVGALTIVNSPVNVSIDQNQWLWVDLPTSWGQYLIDTGGGFCANGAALAIVAGINSDGETGLLQIQWVRAVDYNDGYIY